jgi:hypothetical protein
MPQTDIFIVHRIMSTWIYIYIKLNEQLRDPQKFTWEQFNLKRNFPLHTQSPISQSPTATIDLILKFHWGYTKKGPKISTRVCRLQVRLNRLNNSLFQQSGFLFLFSGNTKERKTKQKQRAFKLETWEMWN